MWQYQNTDELYHHGVIGMRWGVRRYQNKDGSLTAAGKKRAKKLEDKYYELTNKKLNPKNNPSSNISDTPTRKKTYYKDANDNDLQKATNRLRMENEFLNQVNINKKYFPAKVKRSPLAVRVVKSAISDVVAPAGKNVARNYLERLGKNYIDKQFSGASSAAKEVNKVYKSEAKQVEKILKKNMDRATKEINKEIGKSYIQEIESTPAETKTSLGTVTVDKEKILKELKKNKKK